MGQSLARMIAHQMKLPWALRNLNILLGWQGNLWLSITWEKGAEQATLSCKWRTQGSLTGVWRSPGAERLLGRKFLLPSGSFRRCASFTLSSVRLTLSFGWDSSSQAKED